MIGRIWNALGLRRGWRAMVTAFGLGMLAVLALPPLHIIPALFFAIPGLLAMIGGAASWTAAFWIGFAWGFGFFLGGLYWITSAILTDVARYWWLVPIAVPALALPLAFFCRWSGGDCLGCQARLAARAGFCRRICWF